MRPMKETKDKAWDIIPDIHGQRGKLESLLARLGYEQSGSTYSHPERRALFLGDYIDRGPDVRGVLRIVRAMVDAGEAVALMGNHELNALHFHHQGPDGMPLRPHETHKVAQHSATLEQFAGMDDEWRDWLAWFKSLPVTFETDGFRAVHACWDGGAMKVADGGSLHDEEFLVASARKGSAEHAALERLLKGPEIDLPCGITFLDKDGHTRPNLRIRWWGLDEDELRFSDLVMPPGADAPTGLIDSALVAEVPNYAVHEKPVFFGHYWLPWQGEASPLAHNAICLDYCAGKDGPLVACRWGCSIGDSVFVASGAEKSPVD